MRKCLYIFLISFAFMLFVSASVYSAPCVEGTEINITRFTTSPYNETHSYISPNLSIANWKTGTGSHGDLYYLYRAIEPSPSSPPFLDNSKLSLSIISSNPYAHGLTTLYSHASNDIMRIYAWCRDCNTMYTSPEQIMYLAGVPTLVVPTPEPTPEPTETGEPIETDEPVTTAEPEPTPDGASLEQIQVTLDRIYRLMYMVVVLCGAIFLVWLIISPLWYFFR